MKTKLAIATVATLAAFASIGNAVAGELYGELERQARFPSGTVNAALNDGPAITGGELYGLVEHQAAGFVGSAALKPSAPSIYALGGEFIRPMVSTLGAGLNTELAE